MFCFKCGKELVDGAMFCAFCGTNVQALYGGNISSVSEKEEKKGITDERLHNEDDFEEAVESAEAIVAGEDESNGLQEPPDSDIDDEGIDNEGIDSEDIDDEREYALQSVEQNNVVLYENASRDDLIDVFFKDNEKFVIPLGGRDIKFRPGMLQVTLINSCFDDVALKAAKMIEDFYKSAGNIETVINGINEEAVNILQASVQNTLKFLGMVKIYDYNSTDILRYTGRKSKYRQHDASTVEIWDAAIGSIYEEYCAINEEADNEKLNREIRKESRSRMTGMGFGLSGAIEAQMKAGAYNMATGAAHSIFNAVGNAMTDSARSDRLKALYESDETRRILIRGMYDAIQQLKFDTIALCNIEYLYNRQGIAKVNTVLENISHGAVPESRLDSVITDLLLDDPFNENIYRLCMERFGDHNYELSLLARFFDMEDCVSKIKTEVLVNNLNNNSLITNKKAIIELVSDDHNVDWVYHIEDRSKISFDVEVTEKIYNELNLNVNNEYIMSSLRLVEKNIANREGILTNDILTEMLYTYFKYAFEIDTVSDVKNIPLEILNLPFIADKYCLDIKEIGKECFKGLKIKELILGNLSLENLAEGVFRDSEIEAIDKLAVKHIPAYAFENCENLVKVDFLQDTVSIGKGAFNGCNKLQLVVLPKTVITLPEEISDNKNIYYECYDRNVKSYKLCAGFGWNTKVSPEAEAFEKGQDCEKQGDYNQAFQYYKKAADGEYIYAFEPLAKCYYNAAGTEQNFEEAFKYFNMADQTVGNPICKHTIGFMYQNGQGAPVDIFKAMMYYLEAGKAGVAWSMNAIAMIYYQGLGGYANYIEAVKWFAKAANAGDETAKNNLEQFLAQHPGFPPVPDNGEADYDIKYLAQHNVTAVTRYLFNEFDKKSGSGFYYYGMTDKAVKKFNNAIIEYVQLNQGEIPIVCFDHTIFGSAKDGCVLTDYGVYIHNDGGEKQRLTYGQIVNVTRDEKNIILHSNGGGRFPVEVGADDKIAKLQLILHRCLSYFK